VPIAPDNLPDDPAALKSIIAAMARDGLTAQAEIARLKFQLARYRRAEFGRSSEKLARETEQLELALETLETDQAERLATASPTVAAAVEERNGQHARDTVRPLQYERLQAMQSLVLKGLEIASVQIFPRDTRDRYLAERLASPLQLHRCRGTSTQLSESCICRG
jgi:hypothetical protein